MADNHNLKILNPGSLASVERGCTCPLAENNYGFKAPLPDEMWWVDINCKIHGDSHSVDVVPPIEITG